MCIQGKNKFNKTTSDEVLSLFFPPLNTNKTETLETLEKTNNLKTAASSFKQTNKQRMAAAVSVTLVLLGRTCYITMRREIDCVTEAMPATVCHEHFSLSGCLFQGVLTFSSLTVIRANETLLNVRRKGHGKGYHRRIEKRANK